MRGNDPPYGRPSGRGEDGPVVPWQPPSTLAATTNDVRVSSGAPGPISPSHQPAVGCPGPAEPTTCESPVSACRTRTASAASGEPQVSYATVTAGRCPPSSRSSAPTSRNLRSPTGSPTRQP